MCKTLLNSTFECTVSTRYRFAPRGAYGILLVTFTKMYKQLKAHYLFEKKKEAAAAAAAKEAARENKETKWMAVEEKRSWDAYELNARNHRRMIEQVVHSDNTHILDPNQRETRNIYFTYEFYIFTASRNKKYHQSRGRVQPR